MNILLHICCGPCAIMPVRRLLDEGHTVTGFFYNPNIHPLAEYLRRRDGAAQVAQRYGIPMIWALEPDDYNIVAWLHMIYGHEDNRCGLCWGQRLQRTCTEAARGFDAFTSSLLYSRYQQHDFIRAKGEALAQEAGGLVFYYRDFRTDWQEGIDLSKKLGIYRQQYCGCILSENDRYAKALKHSNKEFDNIK